MENENWFVSESSRNWLGDKKSYWSIGKKKELVRARLVGLVVQLTILTCDELAGNEVGRFI